MSDAVVVGSASADNSDTTEWTDLLLDLLEDSPSRRRRQAMELGSKHASEIFDSLSPAELNSIHVRSFIGRYSR